ncbi:MAG: type I methionyl aminopeptidase [Candidatus Paceibacterota bacterium]
MIAIKTPKEIKILREGGEILASVLREVEKKVRPGVATIELDELAEKLIRRAGGEPSFKNYKTREDRVPYPASLCVSIDDEVVHGIPKKEKILIEGDIVSLDLGMKYNSLYTDAAITVPVGEVEEKTKKLIEVCKKSLSKGIKAAKSGATIGDIGFAVQSYVEKKGFKVVRNLAGHGVGYKVHEEPEIPNFGKKGTGEILKAGMVLAIEPMITAGGYEIILDDDNWTWKTKDGSLSAHFEHTIVVTKKGGEILTK